MPYELEWEDKGLLIKYSGVVSSVDIIMSNSEMTGVQKIESVEYLIYDFDTIKDIDLKESIVDIIKKFAERNNHINPLAKVAFVSNREDVTNLIESFISTSKPKIPHANYKNFTNIEEARRWTSS